MTPALQKLQLYKRLYALNRALTLVVLNCDRLEKLAFFSAEHVRAWRMMTQHLQSEANSQLIETLQNWEEKEAFRLDQMRREWEKQMADPNDVLLAAEERKREIRQQMKELKQAQKRRPGRPQRE